MKGEFRGYWQRRLSRRRLIQAAAIAAAGLGAVSLAGCGDDNEEQAKAAATPLPPPETASVRLALFACDAPFMVSERYLREEGFTDIQLLAPSGVSPLTEARVDLAALFVFDFVAAIEAGTPLVGLGGMHPGCSELWAPKSVQTLKDIRGRTIVVRARTPTDLAYPFIAVALKNAGTDPSEVNFVVQPDANLTRLYLDGQSDLHYVATTGAISLKTNPENSGHLVVDQAMDKPWSEQQCCIITTTKDWLQKNPIAAKRALRAIYRAADGVPKDRAEAAKIGTDKGFFGGAQNLELVRGAVNMLDFDWRKYDVADSILFHGRLLNQVGLLKLSPDEIVNKGTDLRYTKELATELKKA